MGVRSVNRTSWVATASTLLEAIEVPGKRFCIGTQWHPEFLLSTPERRLFDAFIQASRN